MHCWKSKMCLSLNEPRSLIFLRSVFFFCEISWNKPSTIPDIKEIITSKRTLNSEEKEFLQIPGYSILIQHVGKNKCQVTSIRKMCYWHWGRIHMTFPKNCAILDVQKRLNQVIVIIDKKRTKIYCKKYDGTI